MKPGKRSAGAAFYYGVMMDTDLIHCSAKATQSLDDATKLLGFVAEIVLNKSGEKWTATVLHHGKPVAGADVEIHIEGSDDDMKSKSGKDGLVELPKLAKGRFSIGAVINTPTKGDYNGLKYKNVKEMTSLTVQVV